MIATWLIGILHVDGFEQDPSFDAPCLIEDLIDTEAGLAKLAAIYRERITQLASATLPPDWDGTFEATQK